MAGVGEMLKSPVVWIAGGGIGLVMLMSKGSGVSGGASQTAGAISPAYMTASVQMNAAALGAQIELAGVQAELGKARLAADVANNAQYFGYLKNQDNNNAVLRGKQMETSAGLSSALIASSTAIILDQQGNAGRLALAYVDANKAMHTNNSNVEMEKLKANAQKAVSRNNLIGNIFGSVAKVATAFA